MIARHRGGALHLRLSDTGEVLVVAANDVAPLRPPELVAGPPPVAAGADVAPPAPPMATRGGLAAAPSTEAPSEVRNASDDDDDGLDETMFDRRPLPTAINDDNGASAASDAREIIDLDAPRARCADGGGADGGGGARAAEVPAAEAPAAEAARGGGSPQRSRGRHVHPPRRRRRPRRRRPRRRLSAACARPGRVPPSSRRGPCACRLTARRGVSSSSPAAARYGSSSATRRIQDGLRMGRWSDCTITALTNKRSIDYKLTPSDPALRIISAGAAATPRRLLHAASDSSCASRAAVLRGKSETALVSAPWACGSTGSRSMRAWRAARVDVQWLRLSTAPMRKGAR